MRLCQEDNCSTPVFGTDKKTRKGYCKSHQYLRTDLDRRSSYEKARDKNKVRSLATNQDNDKAKTQVELNKWFAERAKELTGICDNCGGRTSKGDAKYERFCIAHLFPKSKVLSIATDENNFLELCFFGKSCHTNFDNSMIEPQDMKCWFKMQARFEKMYPHIAKDELRFIPQVYLDSL